MYHAVLLLHVFGATVWTGGHLVLALGVLPGALASGRLENLQAFESRFERVGIPALLIQVATGVWLAWRIVPDIGSWFAPHDAITAHVSAKLALLVLTLALALHARLRLIPSLGAQNVRLLAAHIVGVTLLSVLFVVVGVGFRFGGTW
jgi:putative copper export protein